MPAFKDPIDAYNYSKAKKKKMSELIKYGMSTEYLPDWGIKEALREIFQGFQDFGEFRKEIKHGESEQDTLILSNDYQPEDLEFLKIGKSFKREDKSTIGEHGEGLKMAIMILNREILNCTIRTGRYLLAGTTYNDENLGKCFGIEKHLLRNTYPGFKMEIQVPANNLLEYQDSQLRDDHVLFNHWNGDQILKKPAGQIYVGGLYVCTLEKMSHSFNFKPEHVPLDRDRKVPKSWNVEYYASDLLSSWKDVDIKNLKDRDSSMVTSVHKEVAKKFIPELSDDKKKIVFITKDGTKSPAKIVEFLENLPENQPKLIKLKFSMSKKRVPNSILKEFYDTHRHKLSRTMVSDFQILLKKSKNWKS